MRCLPHYMSLLNLVGIYVILFYVFFESNLKKTSKCQSRKPNHLEVQEMPNYYIPLYLCRRDSGPKFPSLKCFLQTDTYLSLAPSTICSPSFTAMPSSL